MFEGHYKYKPVTQAEVDAFKKIREVTVYGYCSSCKKKIFLTWNEQAKLKGRFESQLNTFSEVWDTNLPDLDAMLCWGCYERKESSKKASRTNKHIQVRKLHVG